MKIEIKNSSVVFAVKASQPIKLEPKEQVVGGQVPDYNQVVGNSLSMVNGGASWKYYKYDVKPNKTYRVTTNVRSNYSSGANKFSWVIAVSTSNIVTTLGLTTGSTDYSVEQQVTSNIITSTNSAELVVTSYRAASSIEVYEMP